MAARATRMRAIICTAVLVVLCIIIHAAIALQEVTLSSTLFLGEYARPGERVTFTCEAKDIGTSVLEWLSEEYIGPGGDRIEIVRSGAGNNQTRLGGNTVATRVSVNTYSGITVIVSQLHIMTSEQIPTSSVTCAINDQGPRRNIPFTTTAMPLQEVTLSSTLFLGEYARPGEMVTFTCEARDIGTSVLEWLSEEYIGPGGDRIEIVSSGAGNDQTRLGGNTTATRVSVNTVSGITVIVSQLHIMTSEQIPTSSVTCAINDQGPRDTISFTTTDSIPEVTSTSEPNITTPVPDNQFHTTAEHEDDNSGGLIAGVIAGVIAIDIIATCTCIIIFLCVYIRHKSKVHDSITQQRMEKGISFVSTDMDDRRVSGDGGDSGVVHEIAKRETGQDHSNSKLAITKKEGDSVPKRINQIVDTRKGDEIVEVVEEMPHTVCATRSICEAPHEDLVISHAKDGPA